MRTMEWLGQKARDRIIEKREKEELELDEFLEEKKGQEEKE